MCACGVTAIRAGVSQTFAIGIRLRVEPSIASRHISDRLKTETEEIWGLYGIHIEWSDASSPEFTPNNISLDASLERHFENPRRRQWPPVLGRVVLNPDTPNWKTIHVSFDATESVLALRPAGRTSTAGIVLDQELSRALGRVLAHEIGHVLLGAPYHDRAGLMRAVLRPKELAEADRAPFRLTCDGLGQLRRRLRALAPDAQLMRDSTTVDIEGSRATPELSSESLCIAFQPSR